MLGEEERVGVEVHQNVTIADGRQLQNQHRIVVPESGEKAAVQKERRQAIRPALCDVGELE